MIVQLSRIRILLLRKPMLLQQRSYLIRAPKVVIHLPIFRLPHRSELNYDIVSKLPLQ